MGCLAPILSLIYLISPIDLIPDAIPVAGQLDDITIVTVAFLYAIWCFGSKIIALLYEFTEALRENHRLKVAKARAEIAKAKAGARRIENARRLESAEAEDEAIEV